MGVPLEDLRQKATEDLPWRSIESEVLLAAARQGGELGRRLLWEFRLALGPRALRGLEASPLRAEVNARDARLCETI